LDLAYRAVYGRSVNPREGAVSSLVDWRSKFRDDGTYDGIHLNQSGEASYTELIANAVRGESGDGVRRASR
jgi:hypothetical protein